MPDRYTGGSFPSPDGDTTPLNPPDERVEPVNFPYRGGEQHGVAVEGRPWIPTDPTAADYWDGSDESADEPAEMEPIPVRIVTESGRELRSWRAYQTIARVGEATNLSGQNELKVRVRIRNLEASDGNTIYVGHTSFVSTLSGYPILGGTELCIETEEEIYVVAATADVEVAVLVEHRVA